MAIRPIEILINAKDQASGVFAKLDGKLKAMGVAIAGYFGVKAFAGIVSSAADFEAAMSKVQAATGASGEELVKLKQTAEDAGASTQYTAVQAAEALENLAKAGLSATDAITTLPAVLDLAQAGGVDLAQASEFMTKAVMGMGLSFDQAGRVADVLAKGANASNTSVTGLAQALSYTAPIANTLGVSLESTVAIIGKFADAGIDASRAGTALNSIMSQFADPASKFRSELANAGITTNDFEKALRQLAAAGPAASKAINAVGLESGPALRALLNQGIGALDDLKGQLDNAAGSAKETAAVMGNNLKSAFSGLSSAWEAVTTVLGTPVLPVLKDGVDQLANALRSAVADGTVQKFGETLAAAFQSGATWARAFLATIDFGKLAADLRDFADRTGAAFAQVGEYATNAGNIVKLVYGVMSAGANTVLGAIYGIGSAFAGVASNIQSGLALIYDGFAKVTFGDVSKAYKLAADEIRLSAEATMAASDALGAKSSAAFLAVADSAQMARDGFTELSNGATGAATTLAATQPALDAAALSLGAHSAELAKLRAEYDALAASGGLIASGDKLAQITALLQAGSPEAQAHATAIGKLRAEYDGLMAAGNLEAARAKLLEISKALNDTAPAAAASASAVADTAKSHATAKQAIADHAAGLAALRTEYADAVASGNWQKAAELQQKINDTLRETPAAAGAAGQALADTGKAAADAAAAMEAAYKDLGITTDAALKEVADRAKANFDLLATSGKASARELALGFEDAAKKAIAANDGIAPSWVSASAAARGYTLEVDAAGKASLSAMGAAGSAISQAVSAHHSAAGAASTHAAAVDGVSRAYAGAGGAASAAATNFAKAKSEAEKTNNPKKGQTGGDGTTIPEFDTMEELDTWVERWKSDFRDDNREFLGSTEYIWYQRIMDQAHKKAAQALKSREAVKQAGAAAKAAAAEKTREPEVSVSPPPPKAAGTSSSSSGMAPQLPLPAQPPVRPPPAAAPERSSGSITPHTYVSNVSIQGVGSASLRFADQSSQSATEDLLRKLAQAKGTSI